MVRSARLRTANTIRAPLAMSRLRSSHQRSKPSSLAGAACNGRWPRRCRPRADHRGVFPQPAPARRSGPYSTRGPIEPTGFMARARATRRSAARARCRAGSGEDRSRQSRWSGRCARGGNSRAPLPACPCVQHHAHACPCRSSLRTASPIRPAHPARSATIPARRRKTVGSAIASIVLSTTRWMVARDNQPKPAGAVFQEQVLVCVPGMWPQ